MADARRRFTVIDGGTGAQMPRPLIDTGVIDAHGNAVLRQATSNPPGGGGGEGVIPIFKLDVHRDVQWMRALWAFLVPALAYFLFYFVGEMKDVRKDIAGVDKAIWQQSATINAMDSTLGRIEERLDGNQPQAGPRTGQAGSIRGATQSGVPGPRR